MRPSVTRASVVQGRCDAPPATPPVGTAEVPAGHCVLTLSARLFTWGSPFMPPPPPDNVWFSGVYLDFVLPDGDSAIPREVIGSAQTGGEPTTVWITDVTIAGDNTLAGLSFLNSRVFIQGVPRRAEGASDSAVT